jgi:hypothetical protein
MTRTEGKVAGRSPGVTGGQGPLGRRVAGPALLRCVAGTARLLARHRIHLSRDHAGMRLRFADGPHGTGPARAAAWWQVTGRG